MYQFYDSTYNVNQTMEIKIKTDIFHGRYLNLTSLFVGRKILKYFNDFFIGIFQFHCKSEHKQWYLKFHLK